jgi:hypothetical protein
MNLKKIDDLYKTIVGGNIACYDGSQNRQEFLDCLCYLNQRIAEIDAADVSFLEIGAFKGIWAIAFKVLCEQNNKRPFYTTVTWLAHNPENKSLLKVRDYYSAEKISFRLIDGNSSDGSVVREASGGSYHFVLIDGDHSYNAVLNDIANYMPLAKQLLLFHDINTRDCGVRKAINKSGVKLNIEISHGNIMGIGIHDANSPETPLATGCFFKNLIAKAFARLRRRVVA